MSSRQSVADTSQLDLRITELEAAIVELKGEKGDLAELNRRLTEQLAEATKGHVDEAAI